MYPCSACPDAVAYLRGGAGAPHLWGAVRFYQESNCVLVTVCVWGLPEDNPSGFFGLHIHEGEHCSGDGFSDTGGHYHPAKAPHPCHAGDLPPLMRCNGGAYLAVRTDRFCLRDIIGRTVVIHSNPDDFHSQPAGNAGKKIACGVICRC